MWLSLSSFILVLAAPNLASPNPEAANRLACASNDVWPNGCDDHDNLCQITCAYTIDGRTECEKSSNCPAAFSEAITHIAMNSTKCEDLCTTSIESSGCRFWRWDSAAAQERRCTLMSDAQCKHHKECDKPSKCICGDVGCPGGEQAEDKKNCSSGIEYKAGPAMIHWACYPDDSPSPYNEDTPMPADTTCYTTQPCQFSDSSTKTLQVKCDGAAYPSEEKGAWVRDPPVSGEDEMTKFYDQVLGTDPTPHPLKEIKCIPTNDDVTLDVPKADMGEISQLSCTTPPTEEGEVFKIPAPNTCLLMCDFHLGMTIEGRLDRASGLWAFYIAETGEDITKNPEKVKCWPNLD